MSCFANACTIVIHTTAHARPTAIPTPTKGSERLSAWLSAATTCGSVALASAVAFADASASSVAPARERASSSGKKAAAIATTPTRCATKAKAHSTSLYVRGGLDSSSTCE